MSFSKKIRDLIAATDLTSCQATLIGYGKIGHQYFKALKALSVGKIRVCSRSEGPLKEIAGLQGVTTIHGGFSRWNLRAESNELAIIAVPVTDLIPAALHLREWGFKKFLIEKPIALSSEELHRFLEIFAKDSVDAVCAFNRVAYPSLLEARSLVEKEGGCTSCTYTFTEFTDKLERGSYPKEVMERWGVANSLHVVSMAHALIGLPKRWSTYRSSSSVDWHPSGSIFVGAGLSQKNIPFAYHADWGSTGRWSVEIHTKVSSYRLCPLEKLFRRDLVAGAWQEIPIQSFAPDAKAGLVEQIAAMLNENIRNRIPLLSLQETETLVRYGEEIFGYA